MCFSFVVGREGVGLGFFFLCSSSSSIEIVDSFFTLFFPEKNYYFYPTYFLFPCLQGGADLFISSFFSEQEIWFLTNPATWHQEYLFELCVIRPWQSKFYVTPCRDGEESVFLVSVNLSKKCVLVCLKCSHLSEKSKVLSQRWNVKVTTLFNIL